jgi:N-sulfoglucosamine sulfohydrolase
MRPADSLDLMPVGRAILVAALLALPACANVAWADSTPAPRPNIIVITADDMGLTTGLYGSHVIPTPNLDRLGREGVLFDYAYVTQALCSPSRSSILTGLYPHQNGQIGLWDNYSMRPEITATMPKLLRDAGYATAIIGKLHVKPGSAFPFEDNHSMLSLQTRDVKMVDRLFREFLAGRGDRPFFAMLNFFDPHRPYNNEMNQTDGLPPVLTTPDQATPFRFLDTDFPMLRQQMAFYYNAVARVDIGVGLTLDTLKEQGLDQNTLIFFISDNGPSFPRAKTGNYEAAVRMPMMMAWPARGGGKRVTQLVSSIDILPTILAATGISAPTSPPLPGMSLLPFFTGTPAKWRDYVFTENGSVVAGDFYPRRTVRGPRYKLIHNLDDEYRNPVFAAEIDFPHDMACTDHPDLYPRWIHPPEYELYDLQNDPDEFINLIDDPSLTGVKQELQRVLVDWSRTTDDPLTTPAAVAAARAYDFSMKKPKPAGASRPPSTSNPNSFEMIKQPKPAP